jgi:hypothetical protein
MESLWEQLSKALQTLGAELRLQEKLDILVCMDKTDEPEVLRSLKFTEGPFRNDVALAAKALRSVRGYTVKLVEHRELHAFRDVFLPEFREFAKERGWSEEEVSRLRNEIFVIKTAPALKKWWAKLKGAEDRRAQQEAHRLFLASTKREVVVTDPAPTAHEECDLKLKNLKERASRVESDEGKRLYEEGLKGLTRHDQIRLFKAALRADLPEEVDVVLEEKKVVVEVKTETEVRHTNLTKLIDERFVGLFSFIGGADHQQMALEIVRVLARFGRREMFVGESYLPLNMLRKLVRRDYRLRLARPFNPSLFFVVVATLVKVKVLIKYDGKAKDSMMSLSSHVSDAKTTEAGRVIATVLALKRETSNGG